MVKKFNIKRRTLSEAMKGNTNTKGRKGKKLSEATKKKISDKLSGKNNPMYGMRKEKAPMWKGDNVGIVAIHNWVAKYKPKPEDDKCEICGKIADKKGRTILQLSNIKEHQKSRYFDDFQWGHSSCHRKYDAKKRKTKSKKLKKSKENKYSSQVGYWLIKE